METDADLERLINSERDLDAELGRGEKYGNIQVVSSQSERVGSKLAPRVHVYKRRWYILLVFSLFSFMQNYVWNDWGPIATSSEKVFDWPDSQIALLANWGCITYIISMPFFSWLKDTKGLRPACLLTSFFVALGASLRCITTEQPYFTWLSNICGILNGFAGPVGMAGAPVVSAVWFPPNERTTATAIMSAISVFGVALSFILGPIMVEDLHPPNQTSQSTPASGIHHDAHPIAPSQMAVNLAAVPKSRLLSSNSTEPPYIAEMVKEIKIYMYAHAAVAIAIFLLILLYFPSKPKLPPSTSAALGRVDFRSGLKELANKKHYILIIFTYSLSCGIYNVWSSVLIVNLAAFNVSQDDAGWLGFISTAAGCGLSFIVARLADVFSHQMRAFLLALVSVSAVMFLWLTLLCEGFIPFSNVQVYISCITSGALIGATSPLFYELSCETAYPVSEPVAVGLQTFTLNFLGFVFLMVFYIPNIGTRWVNWVMLGAIFSGIPMLIMFKEQYTRLEVDKKD